MNASRSEARPAAQNLPFEFDAMSAARRYRAALIGEFRPCLRGLVVEVGAGIGQFTSALTTVKEVAKVIALEPDPRLANLFRTAHPTCALIEGTIDSLPATLQPDVIVCVNVLEHIDADESQLLKFHERLVERRGHLCLFVPARPELYAPIDKDLGHFRRYTRLGLRAKLTAAGFRLCRLDYFNLAGYFGWWLNFRLLKKRAFSIPSVRLFDSFVFPITHALEKHLVRPPFGQSLIAIGQASAPAQSQPPATP